MFRRPVTEWVCPILPPVSGQEKHFCSFDPVSFRFVCSGSRPILTLGSSGPDGVGREDVEVPGVGVGPLWFLDGRKVWIKGKLLLYLSGKGRGNTCRRHHRLILVWSQCPRGKDGSRYRGRGLGNLRRTLVYLPPPPPRTGLVRPSGREGEGSGGSGVSGMPGSRGRAIDEPWVPDK